jgi:hypothetical protein
VGPLVKPSLDKVMSTSYRFTGPLLWLGDRLGRNRERAGLHYRSDSDASRWLAGAISALLTAKNGIDCPTVRRVLRMARAEWARA